MNEAEEKGKTYLRMLEAVNREVEVCFDDGDAIYGYLDSFDYKRMLISIRVNINGQTNIYLLNLRYVKSIRYKQRRLAR